MDPRTQSAHLATFRVDVHPERARVRVEPVGELDLATAATLRAQLHELRDSGFESIVLDLRRLTFVDSTGIALIVAEDQHARDTGLHFSLISGPPAVQRVLEVSGVLDEAIAQAAASRAADENWPDDIACARQQE